MNLLGGALTTVVLAACYGLPPDKETDSGLGTGATGDTATTTTTPPDDTGASTSDTGAGTSDTGTEPADTGTSDTGTP
jgi:hypothetical protein